MTLRSQSMSQRPVARAVLWAVALTALFMAIDVAVCARGSLKQSRLATELASRGMSVEPDLWNGPWYLSPWADSLSIFMVPSSLYADVIADEGDLDKIAQLKALRCLRIGAVDERSFNRIVVSRLPLQELDVGLVSPRSALGSLEAMPSLEALRLTVATAELSENKFETEWLHLDRLPHLRTLWLAGGGITDEIATVAIGIRSLEMLCLADAHVSDRVVPALAKLKGLRELRIPGTRITCIGAARLAAALGQYTVTGYEWHE